VFWEASDLTTAKALPKTTRRGPQARIASTGISWLKVSRYDAGKHLRYRGTPSQLLEQTLIVQMQKEQSDMESGLLNLLASIGSTAPFVGLFGTVLDVVAGPTGDALIATAIGIAVAVPAVLAYNFFLRQENFVVSFMYITFIPDTQNKE
jgi:biopolymer transport protein ExbB